MVTCPRCHAEVQPDWDWCQVCGFDPEGRKPPEPAWDAPGGAPVAGAAPFAPGAGGPPPWSTPPAGPLPVYGAGPPPRGRSGSRVALIVVASVVVGALALVVVLVAAVTLLGRARNEVTSAAPTGATVSPQVLSFVPPDGSFGADFPTTPTQTGPPPTEPDSTGGQTWVARTPGGSFVVIEETLVPGKRIDAAGSFSTALNGLTTTFPGTYTSETTTTVAGHPAKLFSLTGTDGLVVRGQLVLTPQALYLAAASGQPGTEASLESFRDSLRLPG